MVGGYCWYYGRSTSYANPVSCDSVCADHGGCNLSGTRDYAGSGGTDAGCKAVFSALVGNEYLFGTNTGASDPVGCVGSNLMGNISTRYKVPNTTCGATTTYGGRPCACNN